MTKQQNITTRRLPEIDLLKAFTVVFSMILIHIWDFASNGYKTSFTWTIDAILSGILGAPVFMFCLGMGMSYSRHQSFSDLTWRGIKLMTYGQILFLFRFFIPSLIALAVNGNYSYGGLWALCFSSSIMQFAGLAFLLMALCWKAKLTDIKIVLLACAMSILGVYLRGVQTDNYGLDQLFGLFWGTETESYFPLFYWFIFVATGKWFGHYYQTLTDKRRFFTIAAPLSIVLATLHLYLMTGTGCQLFDVLDPTYHHFCWMGLPDAIACLCYIPSALALCYLITRLLPTKALSVMAHPSRYINPYYNVSWMYITLAGINITVTNDLALVMVWIVIVALTAATVELYNKYFRSFTENYFSQHSSVWITLVWALTLSAAFYSFYQFEQFPNVFNDYLGIDY